jgi:hypothetical protein
MAHTEKSMHCSVSVRKIKNGYVVSKSTSNGNKYNHEEEYHPKKPNVDLNSIPHIGTACKSTTVNAAALRKASGNKKVKDT